MVAWLRLSLNMSLIDTHTHVSPAAARRGSIVAMCTITDDTVKSIVCVDKFGLFMIVIRVLRFTRRPARCRSAVRYSVGFRFPGIPVSARARGSTSKRHAPLHTALPAPPPPTTTHETPPLAYPQYQTVYARSRGSRSAASRRTGLRPSRPARWSADSGTDAVRFPPTAPAHATGHRRGSPRASSRSSLGPILRVELRGAVA